MSHEQDCFVERRWSWFVIAFGIVFLAILVSFKPTW